MTDETEKLAACPFCGVPLDTNRTGTNPRHPDNDCFLSGWVIPRERLSEWNARTALATKETGCE